MYLHYCNIFNELSILRQGILVPENVRTLSPESTGRLFIEFIKVHGRHLLYDGAGKIILSRELLTMAQTWEL